MYGISNSKYYILWTCSPRACIWCNRRLLWCAGNHVDIQFEGKTEIWCFQTSNIWIFGSSSSLDLDFSRNQAKVYISLTTDTRVLYDKHTQLKKLTTELNCLRWASALMGLVYNFIKEHKSSNAVSPSFVIPDMVFIKSALAISDIDQEVFLLEEVINDAVEGPFIKYIGNGSVTPYNFLKGEERRLGEFLSFCQHVQYLKTKGLAIVGDFQGKRKKWKMINS